MYNQNDIARLRKIARDISAMYPAASYIHKRADLTEQQLIDISRPYYTDSKWQHIQDVLRYAKQIKQQPLSDLQKAVIYMHDTQKKRIGNSGHQAASAELTKKLFKDKYTKDKLRRIYLAIKQHSPDYRNSRKNFHHSSPQAQLLALADDSNNLKRDPDLMAMVSVKFQKSMPDVYDTPQKGLDRHKQFFGPLHGHGGLKYYKDRWNQYAKQGIKNIDNYPQGKYNLLWSLVNKDTELPDIDALNKE